MSVVQLLDAALMLNSSKEIYKFTNDLIQKLKRYSVASIILIEKGMHAAENIVMLESLSDGVIEFRLFKEGFDVKRGARIVKMRGLNVEPGFHQFSVTDQGLAVYVTKT